MSTTTKHRWTTRPLPPRHKTWPYKPSDFHRLDPSPDSAFYAQPRNYIYHIDNHAVDTLKNYYSTTLPQTGELLDLCSSWTCVYPMELEIAAVDPGGALKVVGLGMSEEELETNRTLAERLVVDLNDEEVDVAGVLGGRERFAAATCCVSVDYLVRPREVLEGVRRVLEKGALLHLVLSNRCFPSKAVKRWLQVGEEERVEMVGDYLHFAGFGDVEVVEFQVPRGADPLWVVRGRKV